ncbi:MAG: methionyl-tRNA formyltransferase [Chitinophagaceae bacterium]|nr:methionyl-tRNA formyltransferase [Chitinophagaceae bacterium]
MKIILLCSGGLGQTILEAVNTTRDLVFVFTDKKSKEIIAYCEKNQIDFFAGNPRLGKADEIIAQLNCDVLLSVNYLFVVKENILNLASKYAINFHGSLLPKYRGRTPHVWAIINGEKKTGISAHLMTTEVDDGAIVKQVEVKIGHEDTGSSILEKFGLIFPKIVDEVLEDVKLDQLKKTNQNHLEATYYQKRTPEDGHINWNWHKERIRNWVRAQAAPYPGAFCFYENKKIIINKMEFDEHGFTNESPNGLILATNPFVIVKVSNGAIKILEFGSENVVNFKKGDILK